MLTFDQGNNRFSYRTAGICVHENHVLLHKIEGDDSWFFPGGRVDMLENSRSALYREMVEEMGAEVKVGRLLWFMETFYQDDRTDRHFHELGLYYQFFLPETFYHFEKTKPFYGTETKPVLVFKWFPLEAVDEDFALHPVYFRKTLHHLPDETVHVIHQE